MALSIYNHQASPIRYTTCFTVGFHIFPPRNQSPTIIHQRRLRLPPHLLPRPPRYARPARWVGVPRFIAIYDGLGAAAILVNETCNTRAMTENVEKRYIPRHFVGPSKERVKPAKGCLRGVSGDVTYVVRQFVRPSRERGPPRRGCLKKGDGEGEGRVPERNVGWVDELPSEVRILVTVCEIRHDEGEVYKMLVEESNDEDRLMVGRDRVAGEGERKREVDAEAERRRADMMREQPWEAENWESMDAVERDQILRKWWNEERRLGAKSVLEDGARVSADLGVGTSTSEVEAEPEPETEKITEEMRAVRAAESAEEAVERANEVRAEVEADAENRRAVMMGQQPVGQAKNKERKVEVEREQMPREMWEREGTYEGKTVWKDGVWVSQILEAGGAERSAEAEVERRLAISQGKKPVRQTENEDMTVRLEQTQSEKSEGFDEAMATEMELDLSEALKDREAMNRYMRGVERRVKMMMRDEMTEGNEKEEKSEGSLNEKDVSTKGQTEEVEASAEGIRARDVMRLREENRLREEKREKEAERDREEERKFWDEVEEEDKKRWTETELPKLVEKNNAGKLRHYAGVSPEDNDGEELSQQGGISSGGKEAAA